MRVPEIQQVLLVCPVVFLQVGSVLRSHRLASGLFCLLPNCVCQKYLTTTTTRSFPQHSLLYFALRGRAEDRMRLRGTIFFFSPWTFSVSNFGRVFLFIPWSFGRKQWDTHITFKWYQFRTEGSQYLEFIFLQFFSLFGNCCHFPCMICTGVLKWKVT